MEIPRRPEHCMLGLSLLQKNTGEWPRQSMSYGADEKERVCLIYLFFLARCLMDEALACELTGYFFIENDLKAESIEYFLQAHVSELR